MDDFFVPVGNNKKKRDLPNNSRGSSSKTQRSDSQSARGKPSLDPGDELGAPSSSEDERSHEATKDPFANETPDEKRLRLAQELIDKLRAENEAGDEQQLGERLQQEAREAAGLKHRKINTSIKIAGEDAAMRKVSKGHTLAVTSVAIADDETQAFTASKDGTIVTWNVETGQRMHTFQSQRKSEFGHDGPVLAVAVTSDGTLLASGGEDRIVRVWDLRAKASFDTFKGHKAAVTGLAFRFGTHQLYSGSADATVKLWNVDERSYIETLFGHTDAITSLDAMARERAISASRDKTIRLWKVTEETQLLFQGWHTASVDCLHMLSEDTFVSGSEDGSIAVWSSSRKKPLATLPRAHALEPTGPAPWITSIATLRGSDIFASGSSTGRVKLWQYISKQISPIAQLPSAGYVNALAFGKSGHILVAGVGRDHRLGRWSTLPEARNGIHIFKLTTSD